MDIYTVTLASTAFVSPSVSFSSHPHPLFTMLSLPRCLRSFSIYPFDWQCKLISPLSPPQPEFQCTVDSLYFCSCESSCHSLSLSRSLSHPLPSLSPLQISAVARGGHGRQQQDECDICQGYLSWSSDTSCQVESTLVTLLSPSPPPNFNCHSIWFSLLLPHTGKLFLTGSSFFL